MGNGIWTVEIIPAEIQPPARSIEGASGNRIRIGVAPRSRNGGDEADLVVAFNDQVLLRRVREGRARPAASSCWRASGRPRRSGHRRHVPGPSTDDEAARWLPAPRSADGASSACAGGRRAARQEHVRAGPAVQHLYSSTWTSPCDKSHGLLKKGADARRARQLQLLRSRLRLGRRTSTCGSRCPRPPDRAADRGQRQHALAWV
jgi:hypothetical protein